MHSLLIELSLTGSLLSPVTRGECHPGTDPSSCPTQKGHRIETPAGFPSKYYVPTCENAGESETELLETCGEPCPTRSSDHPVALSGD